jgi:hypothetical protein
VLGKTPAKEQQMYRFRPSPSMIVALLALFVALSGGAYAFSLKKNSVKTRSIKNGAVTNPKLARGAVTGSKVAPGSLTGANINQSTLTVPSAKLQCPPGTSPALGLCVETSDRAAANWFAAQANCAAAGRRLPEAGLVFQLENRAGFGFTGPEISATTGFDGTAFYYLRGNVISNTPALERRTSASDTDPYRCVIEPSN